MFGAVLPKLLAGVGKALRNKKKKKKVKGKLRKKKGMLKGSIKKRLTKRNKRKYGGFLGGKNLNKKGKPKKPPKKTLKKKGFLGGKRVSLNRKKRAFSDIVRRHGSPINKRPSRRKLKPGNLTFKRHLDRKAKL